MFMERVDELIFSRHRTHPVYGPIIEEIEVSAQVLDSMPADARAARVLAIEDELKRRLDSDVYRKTVAEDRERRRFREEGGNPRDGGLSNRE